MTRSTKGFSESTRGRIVTLLRRGDRTVDELATILELTDNGVRAQLSTLERDGLVEQSGVRRSGSGKPAHLYGLAPEAERLFFSKACPPFLVQFLDAATAGMNSNAVLALMRKVGQGLASAHAAVPGDARARVDAAARLLDELGGMTEVEARGGTLVIHGHHCPVGALVEGHPEVCLAVESFVSAVTRMPARKGCDRADGRARCYLEVTPPRPARREAARSRRSRAGTKG